MSAASGTLPAAPVIAIDGPSASGKGTVAAAVAARLRWAVLDSGALYRVVGLVATRRGIDLADGEALSTLVGELDIAFANGAVRVNDKDESAAIRAPAVAAPASRVGAVPAVREALLVVQRRFRRPPGLVADGRDMGTVVFADAELKVFLTASAEARALRRQKQLGRASAQDFNGLLAAMRRRDERDRNRSVAPLTAAPDAVVIDSTTMPAAAVVDQVLTLAGRKGLRAAAFAPSARAGRTPAARRTPPGASSC